MKTPSFDFDWEERIFRSLRALLRLAGKRKSSAEDSSSHNGTVYYQDLQARLILISQVLAEEPVILAASESAGGIKGNRLLFPKSITLSEQSSDNEKVYIVRAAVSARMRLLFRRGQLASMMNDPVQLFQHSHPALLLQFSLRAAEQAVHSLCSELPEFADLHAHCLNLCLENRRLPRKYPAGLEQIEAYRLQALRGEKPWTNTELTAQLQRLSADSALFHRMGSGAMDLWGEFLPLEIQHGELGISADLEKPETATGTEVEAPTRDEIEMVRLSKKDQEDNVLIHAFEKVETAEEFSGGARETDADDDLQDHLEALDEIDLRHVIRGGEEAQAIYKADLRLNAEIPDVSVAQPLGRGIPYDEWDFRKSRYRRDWCMVYPCYPTAADPAWAASKKQEYARTIGMLERELIRFRHKLAEQDRQLDGEEIDIPALCDELAFRSAGETASEKVYIRHSRLRHEVGVTVLLDLSLSSDSWVNNRRVLDISRDAVFVLGETCHRLGDHIEVLGFASHTRNRCRVWKIIGRNDEWPAVRARLGALKAQGYTRIGPALRHATHELASLNVERRLLLLISDGKPNDYDRYEGRYGIADIRQALREAHQQDVHVHALAVDAVARNYLPSMLGKGAWHILKDPDKLVPALTEIYGRLTAS